MDLPISYEEKGKAIGREEGREEGKAFGKKEALKQVALNMLANGLPTNFISEVTNLKEEDIENLKETLE